VLRRRTARRGRLAVALVTALITPIALTSLTASAAQRPTRVLDVAPDLGLPGLAVRFSGSGVPRHLHLSVLFDVSTKDKHLLCSTTNGASTKWRCTGRIPRAYGRLGIHTVEMDATPVSGRGAGFEELSTFLVTDLGVTMSAPATTAPGDTVPLRVTVSNGNSVVARGVRVHDALPRGLRLKTSTAPCKVTHGGIECGPLRMPARSTRVFLFTTIVTASHPSRLVDTVTVSGTPDPLHRNDAAHASIRVT
jgi:uncharacterized repeat protein (TIGR01451 family)